MGCKLLQSSLLGLQLLYELKALVDPVRLKFQKVQASPVFIAIRFTREVDKLYERAANLQSASVDIPARETRAVHRVRRG